MKNITKQFLYTSLSLCALTVVSCNNDNATGKSTLEVVKGITGSVTLNPGLMATQTVNEPKNFRDATLNETLNYSYKVTIDKPQSVDIHVKVVQVSGAATEGDDFTFDKDLLIPAFETSATGTITIFSDAVVEGDEDFKLQIGTASTSNATLVASNVSFIIQNFKSKDLELSFDYNQPLNLFGNFSDGLTLYNTTVFDMDFYVTDSNGNDTGLYEAAQLPRGTEKLIISDEPTNPDGSPNLSYLPDGTYFVVYYIFKNNFDVFYPTIGLGPARIPTTVNYLRRGGIAAGTFKQEADYAPTSLFPISSGLDPANFVVSVTKQNGTFTLGNSTYDPTNPISVPIASGRVAANNTKLKNWYKNHKKN